MIKSILNKELLDDNIMNLSYDIETEDMKAKIIVKRDIKKNESQQLIGYMYIGNYKIELPCQLVPNHIVKEQYTETEGCISYYHQNIDENSRKILETRKIRDAKYSVEYYTSDVDGKTYKDKRIDYVDHIFNIAANKQINIRVYKNNDLAITANVYDKEYFANYKSEKHITMPSYDINVQKGGNKMKSNLQKDNLGNYSLLLYSIKSDKIEANIKLKQDNNEEQAQTVEGEIKFGGRLIELPEALKPTDLDHYTTYEGGYTDCIHMDRDADGDGTIPPESIKLIKKIYYSNHSYHSKVDDEYYKRKRIDQINHYFKIDDHIKVIIIKYRQNDDLAVKIIVDDKKENPYLAMHVSNTNVVEREDI